MTPPEQSNTIVTSPRRRYSPPRAGENSKPKSAGLPKLEEDTNTGAVSPVKELTGTTYIMHILV